MTRKILTVIAATLFGLCLYGTVLTFSVRSAVQAENAKRWLSSSGIYNDVIQESLKSADKKPLLTEGSVDLSLSDPNVRKIIVEAVPPDFIKSSSESVIDASFKWLNGDVKTPSFAINVADIKTKIIDGVGNYAKARYIALPACPDRTLPSTTDILKINCRPAFGIDVDQAIAKFKADLSTNKEFLPDSTINANNLSLSETGKPKDEPVFQKLDELPKIYQLIQIAPFILGALVLGLGAVVVFVSARKRLGLKHIAVTLVSSGALLLFGVFVSRIGVDKAEQAILKSSGTTTSPIIQKDLAAVTKSAIMDLTRPTLWFGALFVVIAAGIFTYLIVTRQKALGPTAQPPVKP